MILEDPTSPPGGLCLFTLVVNRLEGGSKALDFQTETKCDRWATESWGV